MHSVPFQYADYGFIYRRDQPIPRLFQIIRLPFSVLVWILCGVSILLFSALTAGFWQHPTQITQNVWGLKKKISEGFNAFMRSFWTVGMLALQQGLPDSYFFHRKPYTQKIMFAVWLFMTFVLAATYGSKMIGILLDRKEENIPFLTIQGLTDQMQQNGYRLIITESEVDEFEARMNYLSRKPEFRDYVEAVRRYPPEKATSLDVLVYKLLQDPYLVYPARLTTAEYGIPQSTRCPLRSLISWEQAVPVSLGFRENFPNMEKFNRELLTFSTVFYEQIRRKYVPETRCGKYMKYTDMSLSMYELQAAFWFWGVGIVLLAIPYLLGEWVVERIKKFVRNHEEMIRNSMRKITMIPGSKPHSRLAMVTPNQMDNGTAGFTRRYGRSMSIRQLSGYRPESINMRVHEEVFD